jgi:DNA-binding HxlR family transcriptional regulator
MQELKHMLPMISEDTILRDLRDLMEKGILTKEGSTKASRYIIANK